MPQINSNVLEMLRGGISHWQGRKRVPGGWKWTAGTVLGCFVWRKKKKKTQGSLGFGLGHWDGWKNEKGDWVEEIKEVWIRRGLPGSPKVLE
ncbi:hypothetical protein H5410_022758 [Solanum commersonii]|uniref:Uncharacterized protein n=1 Tax=Solanum commersonii TaxID=4109 RepID=A0A9J5ZGC6_SOLCO|nr:hypothetical protein H5410_022758 [Solanum commersonii]